MVTPLDRFRAAAEAVEDPELPPLTIADLGILRGISLKHDTVEVLIAPTWSGCPAMRAISDDIETALRAAGAGTIRVRLITDPPWTTDWLTDTGRNKLLALGIVPPEPAGGGETLFGQDRKACPRCQSPDTERLSAFGSTACKAQHRCRACREPFEAFKCR